MEINARTLLGKLVPIHGLPIFLIFIIFFLEMIGQVHTWKLQLWLEIPVIRTNKSLHLQNVYIIPLK